MTDSVRFVLLTPEDEEALGTPNSSHVTGVALNENNECVSISTLEWPMRYQLCGSCDGKCSWGGVVWTRDDYQQQGIFYRLFFWTKEQAGLETTYISKNDPFNLLLAEKYNLKIPMNIESLPALENKHELRLAADDMADRITARFQANA